MAAYKDTLRSLALNDERFVDSVLEIGATMTSEPALAGRGDVR
jgi:hypothetical protein